MMLFDDGIMRGLLSRSLETARITPKGWEDVGKGPGSDEGQYINFLSFSDLEGSVAEDVRRIRRHPLVPSRIPIYGFYYDVKTGKLVEVPEAMKAGKAS
jgi:carbonic anhydrase